MKTTEEQAHADRHLAETFPPDMDRRAIRCRCRHSLDAHPTNAFPSGGALVQFLASGQAVWAPCTRCDCQRFQSRPAVWRVAQPPYPRELIAVVRDCGFFSPEYVVTSPRGAEVARSSDLVAAFNLAQQMAAVDRLLARVARIEAAVGWHPSHGTPPPSDSAMRPGRLTVLDGGQ